MIAKEINPFFIHKNSFLYLCSSSLSFDNPDQTYNFFFVSSFDFFIAVYSYNPIYGLSRDVAFLSFTTKEHCLLINFANHLHYYCLYSISPTSTSIYSIILEILLPTHCSNIRFENYHSIFYILNQTTIFLIL